MKYAGLGGAAVPVAVTTRLTELGMTVFRSYGSTEHPSITGSRYTAPEAKRLCTDGDALPGTEIRLAEDGEILSRGPDLCLGYTDPALTERAFDGEGWYRTGDIGVIDEDGYLTITDRKADIIIRGGENIGALEVEEALLALAGRGRGRRGGGPRRPPRRTRGCGPAAEARSSRAHARRDACPPRTGGPGPAEVAGGAACRAGVPADGERQGAEVRSPSGHCRTSKLRIGFS